MSSVILLVSVARSCLNIFCTQIENGPDPEVLDHIHTVHWQLTLLVCPDFVWEDGILEVYTQTEDGLIGSPPAWEVCRVVYP